MTSIPEGIQHLWILLFVEYPEQGDKDNACGYCYLLNILNRDGILQMLESAVVQESVSQIVSGILQKYEEKQNSNAV
jgi:hypothetical protein